MLGQSSFRIGRHLSRQLHSSGRQLASQASDASSSYPPSSLEARPNAVASIPMALPRNQVEVGPTMQNRLDEHYDRTLVRDLQYMTYDHRLESMDREEHERRQFRFKRQWDPSSPYSKHRPEPPNRGNRALPPSAINYANKVVKLDRVIISTMTREAIRDKRALIPILAIMRAVTARPIVESKADPKAHASWANHRAPKQGHVRIVKAKTGAAAWKLREGMPIGVRAELSSKHALHFIELLVTFVMPRMRTFSGIEIPPRHPPLAPSAVSGVVSFGFGADAMSLFPQTEINWDAYPNKPAGFQIDFITNQRGEGASEKARQLLSGLGIPFVRHNEA